MVLLAGLFQVACAHSGPSASPCEQPPPFTLRLEAGARLNPDDQGRSLPTNVQVFQLKDSRRFEAAEFQDLWQRSKEVLEDDLVAVDEFTLDPSQSLTRQLNRSPKAEYVAVLGVFRRPAGQAWRDVERLPRIKPEECGPAAKAGSREAALRFSIEDYRVESRLPEVRR